MKKILCLIDTLGLGGGAERQMAGLAGLLHLKGKDVIVATYHRHNTDDFLEHKYGIRSKYLDVKPNPWSKFYMVLKYIKKNKFDVVIAYKNGPTMICCMLKILGIKFKLIVSERNTTQKLNRREKIKFFLYKWADYIVPNSNTQASFIQEHFPYIFNKVNVITNFTDLSYFKPSDICLQKRNLNILVTARIAKQKNVLGFMSSIKKLKDKGINVKIDWYGSVYAGQEQYGELVKREYEKLGIEDIFSFHHATSQILEAYQKCDIFCLPSFYEGFPNVICEAMSCGKPILCSNVCDNPYIVQDGVNGLFFNPLDENDMVDKIIKMVSLSKEERDEMGRRSRVIAESLLSEEVFVKKYIKLIEA